MLRFIAPHGPVITLWVLIVCAVALAGRGDPMGAVPAFVAVLYSIDDLGVLAGGQ